MSATDDTSYNAVPTKETSDKEAEEVPSSYGLGIRHIQLWLAGSSLTIAYIARAHMGVTLAAMTRSHFVKASDNTSIPTYDWPKQTLNIILFSFFLAYSIMMIPMGLICQRWGGKVPLQFCLAVNGFASVLTPWLMNWGGWSVLLGCRILHGLSQAAVLPATQAMVSAWSHPDERGKFSSYVQSGAALGTLIAFFLARALASSPWGWPSTFYVTGGLCLLAFVLISYIGSASPAEHETMAKEERNYITGKVEHVVKKNLKVPWMAILKSKYYWATMCAHVGSGISAVFIVVELPLFIDYVFQMNADKNGLTLASYGGSVIMSIVYGLLTYYITTKKWLSIANNRRTFNSFSQIGLTLCYLVLSFTNDVELAVTCMVLAMSFHVATNCGWMVTYIDLAPNYAGLLFSIGVAVGCGVTIVQPLLFNSVINDIQNRSDWRNMFLIMAFISFTTNAIYVLFMSSDVQPWNNYKDEMTGMPYPKQEIRSETEIKTDEVNLQEIQANSP